MSSLSRCSMAGEEWLSVVGWPSYEVSSFGNVRSIDRRVECHDGRTRLFRGVPIAGTVDKRMGYRRVLLWSCGQGVGRTVHSLVAETFLGPVPPGQEVCHRNRRQPADNRASNLYYGTRSDNVRDSLAHGTHNNAKKYECPRGHQLIEPNLVASVARAGRRGCLACARARSYCRYYSTLDSRIISDGYYAKIMGNAIGGG